MAVNNPAGGATFLDNNAVKNAMSAYNIENLIQDIIAVEGFGVTSEYVSDMNVKSVDIPSLLMPAAGQTRELGNGLFNGSAYNANNTATGVVDLADDIYTVNLTYVWDRTQSASRFKSDLAGKRDLEGWTSKNITKAITLEINTSTLAKQLISGMVLAVMYNKDGSAKSAGDQATALANQVFQFDPTKIGPMNIDNTSAVPVFMQANTALSNGDPSYFLGVVPAGERQGFIRGGLWYALKASNAITNADIGLMQQFTGFINPFTQAEGRRVNTTTGEIGVIDGVLCSFVTDYIWNGVYKSMNSTTNKPTNWFGLSSYVATAGSPTATETANLNAIAMFDKVQGIITAAAGTYRGIAVQDEITVVQDNYNPGTRLNIQGVARWGVETLVPPSVKVIVNAAVALSNVTSAAQYLPQKAVIIAGVAGTIPTVIAPAGIN